MNGRCLRGKYARLAEEVKTLFVLICTQSFRETWLANSVGSRIRGWSPINMFKCWLEAGGPGLVLLVLEPGNLIDCPHSEWYLHVEPKHHVGL